MNKERDPNADSSGFLPDRNTGYRTDLTGRIAASRIVTPNPSPPSIRRVAGYDKLENVLNAAYNRAATGKGIKRHAKDGQPFEEQSILTITRTVGLGFPTGQVMKKLTENHENREEQINEYLDCIVYLAAAIIAVDD